MAEKIKIYKWYYSEKGGNNVFNGYPQVNETPHIIPFSDLTEIDSSMILSGTITKVEIGLTFYRDGSSTVSATTKFNLSNSNGELYESDEWVTTSGITSTVSDRKFFSMTIPPPVDFFTAENYTLTIQHTASRSGIQYPKNGYVELRIYFETEENILVSSITLSPSSLTLTEGETATLTATISPSNATNQVLSWSSTNSSVAEVDDEGKVTANSAGSATITCAATDGSGKSASCNVIVKSNSLDIPIESVTITNYPFSLIVTQTGELSYSYSPANATIASIKLSSNKETYASISREGLITALSTDGRSNQTVTFTCIIEDTLGNKQEASCNVLIYNDKVSSISLNPDFSTIDIDEEITITARIASFYAFNKKVSWTYNNLIVEKISENIDSFETTVTAVFKGIREGTSTIRCSADDQNGLVYGEASITVKKNVVPVTSITIFPEILSLEKNDSITFSVTIEPENATTKDIIWSSDYNSSFEKYLSFSGNTLTVIASEENKDITFSFYAVSIGNSLKSNECNITIKGPRTYNAYIYVDGQYKPAKAYIYDSKNYPNDPWRECTAAYVYNNGWKQTKMI